MSVPPRPDLAVGVLRNDLTEAVDQVAVQVANTPEAPVTMAQVGLSTRSLSTPPTGATAEARIRDVSDYVNRLAARGAFSGVVLIGHDGNTVYANAWGEANRDTHEPVTLDTAFNVASLSKIMTAVAILQLVETDVVSLDDSIASIIPAASTDARFAEIRVKHLLSHTSGLDRDPNTLAFPPGTGFLYSNLGFRWLGDVIAARTRMRFEDYLRLKVLGPSGMASTARYELTAVSPYLSTGYTLQSVESGAASVVPVWHPNPYLHTIPGGAMGGLYSTGPDVLRFASALVGGRLVSRATLELMKTAKVELGAPSYGFGVMRERTPGVWGHGGDLPGADAALEFYSDGYVVVVLANMDTVAAPILQKTRMSFHDVSRVG